MTLIGRPHQRRRAPQRLLRVDLGTAVEQELDDAATLPVRDAIMSGVSPRGQLFVRIRAGFQQALHDGGVPVQTRQ